MKKINNGVNKVQTTTRTQGRHPSDVFELQLKTFADNDGETSKAVENVSITFDHTVIARHQTGIRPQPHPPSFFPTDAWVSQNIPIAE